MSNKKEVENVMNAEDLNRSLKKCDIYLENQIIIIGKAMGKEVRKWTD